MQQLTPQGLQKLNELAQRYTVSPAVVMTLLHALFNGNGTMAQFEHEELGGRGQWMRGGMTMVGDMFNQALKAKVDGLCSELSALLAAQPFQPFPSSSQGQSQGGQHQHQGGASQTDLNLAYSPVSLFIPPPAGSADEWWPADLGPPTTVGAQNSVRYAYFPATRRLAVEVSGHVTLYDTRDHQISGVAQQQGRGSSLTFTSQHGVVSLATLPIVSDGHQESRGDVPGLSKSTASPQISGVAQQQGRGSSLTFTSQHGVVSLATLPIVSDGHQESPGDVPGLSKSTASPHPPVLPSGSIQETDIFATLERLAELRHKGILSEEEFAAKKAELLGRV